jgi:circadian clock protein KaiC
VHGDTGTGKTTLALQFLLQGVAEGEAGVYVTLSETAEELRTVAASHGWSIDGFTTHELSSVDPASGLAAAQTLFHPSEVELNETTKKVLDTLERLRPQRVVFDSLSEMRLLARDPLRYRRQILSLKQFFIGRGCTVVLLDDRSSGEGGDLQVDSLVHGILEMEQLAPLYGPERRRLRIKKMRGMTFQGGYHDFRIITGGIEVYPRLRAAEHSPEFVTAPISSGIPALDALLGGGVDRGTSTLIVGPTGTGKTTLALQFALAAAATGDRVAVYLFEERLQTVQARATGLGTPLDRYLREGRILLRYIDPAEATPGELADELRRWVLEKDVRMVVLDTLNGYRNAMPEERFLSLHLHQLLSFLGQRGVATVMVESQHRPIGVTLPDSIEVSFLADTVLLLRHFESKGVVRQALSVLKKRTGAHERTIRELRLDKGGISVGVPLVEFQGVLTGVPTHVPVQGRDATPPKS